MTRQTFRSLGHAVEVYYEDLHRFVSRRTGSASLADDIVQETWIRANAANAVMPDNPRAYLYRTAHNLTVDHLRRQGREKAGSVPEGELAGLADDSPSPEQAVGSRDELAVVRDAVLELPERTRQVFVLARIEGLTYREVAARLGISDSSVQKHLAKATKHVMQRLRVS